MTLWEDTIPALKIFCQSLEELESEVNTLLMQQMMTMMKSATSGGTDHF